MYNTRTKAISFLTSSFFDDIGLVGQFHTAVTCINLISVIQIHLYKFQTILQSTFEEGFDEDNFEQAQLYIILCSLHVLIIFNIQLINLIFNFFLV